MPRSASASSSTIRRASTEPDRLFMPIWLFLALSIAAFASSVTLRIADALLPEIAREFATTPGAAATAVITTFTVAYGGIQAAFGPIGDRFGKVQTIAVASLLSVAAQIA